MDHRFLGIFYKTLSLWRYLAIMAVTNAFAFRIGRPAYDYAYVVLFYAYRKFLL